MMLPPVMWLMTCLCSAALDSLHFCWQQNFLHREGSSVMYLHTQHTWAARQRLTVRTTQIYRLAVKTTQIYKLAVKTTPIYRLAVNTTQITGWLWKQHRFTGWLLKYTQVYRLTIKTTQVFYRLAVKTTVQTDSKAECKSIHKLTGWLLKYTYEGHSKDT